MAVRDAEDGGLQEEQRKARVDPGAAVAVAPVLREEGTVPVLPLDDAPHAHLVPGNAPTVPTPPRMQARSSP